MAKKSATRANEAYYESRRRLNKENNTKYQYRREDTIGGGNRNQNRIREITQEAERTGVGPRGVSTSDGVTESALPWSTSETLYSLAADKAAQDRNEFEAQNRRLNNVFKGAQSTFAGVGQELQARPANGYVSSDQARRSSMKHYWAMDNLEAETRKSLDYLKTHKGYDPDGQIEKDLNDILGNITQARGALTGDQQFRNQFKSEADFKGWQDYTQKKQAEAEQRKADQEQKQAQMRRDAAAMGQQYGLDRMTPAEQTAQEYYDQFAGNVRAGRFMANAPAKESTSGMESSTQERMLEAAKQSDERYKEVKDRVYNENAVRAMTNPNMRFGGNMTTTPTGAWGNTDASGRLVSPQSQRYEEEYAAADPARRLAAESVAEKDADNPLVKQGDIGIYRMMTDQERATYNYLYTTYGPARAQEYHNGLLDEINRRIGQERYDTEVKGMSTAQKAARSFQQGFGSGVQGILDAPAMLLGGEVRRAKGAEEYENAALRSDPRNSRAEQILYDISSSTGNMAPGIMASFMGAPEAVGSALFAASAGGNAYMEALNNGEDIHTARAFGVQQTADEAVTNWLLGGINAFGGGALRQAFSNSTAGQALNEAVGRLAQSETGKQLLRSTLGYAGDMLGEAQQEYLQFYTESFTRALLGMRDENGDPAQFNFNLADPDALYAALLGALNAGALNAAPASVKAVTGARTDISNAAGIAEDLRMATREAFTSDAAYESAQMLRSVAEGIAQKQKDGQKVTVADRIAYNEAMSAYIEAATEGEAETEETGEMVPETHEMETAPAETADIQTIEEPGAPDVQAAMEAEQMVPEMEQTAPEAERVLPEAEQMAPETEQAPAPEADRLMDLAREKARADGQLRMDQENAIYDAVMRDDPDVQSYIDRATMLSDADVRNVLDFAAEQKKLQIIGENDGGQGADLSGRGSGWDVSLDSGERAGRIPEAAGLPQAAPGGIESTAGRDVEGIPGSAVRSEDAGSYGRLAEGAREKVRAALRNAADSEAHSLKLEKAADARTILPVAKPGQQIYSISRESATPSMRKGASIAKAAGCKNVYLFASDGNIQTSGGSMVRAWCDTKTGDIGIMANNRYADGEQLGKHEACELGIADGRIKTKEALETVRITLDNRLGGAGQEFIDRLALAYAKSEKRSGIITEADMEHARKEMLCDAAGGINQFRAMGWSGDYAAVMDVVSSIVSPYVNDKLGGAFDVEEDAGTESANGGQIEMEDGVASDGTTMEGRNAFQFSEAIYKKSGRQYLQEWLSGQEGLSQEDKRDVVAQIDHIYDIMQQIKNENEGLDDYRAWAQIEDRNGRLTVITPNGEYPLNIDFATVCKKRKALDYILNAMVSSGELDAKGLAGADIVALQDIIKKEGFEVACALCFVDSKRYRVGRWADEIVNGKDGKTKKYGYNELVRSLVPAGSKLKIDQFNYTGRDVKQPRGKLLKNAPDSALDFTLIDKVIATNSAGSWNRNLAQAIKAHPELRSLLNSAELLSSVGFDPIRINNPALFDIINNAGGSSKPKLSFAEQPYLNDILMSDAMTPEQAYAVGGVRVQSFSDFMANMVFDYVQMVGELQAKKLPAHAYTKEAAFVMMFGKTGIKINMSLVPKATTWSRQKLNEYLKQFKGKGAKEAALRKLKSMAGLDAHGNYIWEDESFPYAVAMHIQGDPEYAKNCGTIAVGVSDRHIMKLLDDPTIQMVIPYHKSGINPVVARLRGIDLYNDYTNKQNTRYKNGRKIIAKANTFDFYATLKETGDPKATADAYLRWCDEKGFLPKFDKFRKHPNYYKLLADFRLYDDTGAYAPQGPVKGVYPENMKELILNGYTYTDENGVTYQNGGLRKAQEVSDDLKAKAQDIIEQYRARREADFEGSSELSPESYAPTFYSKLQREVEAYKGEKMGAASVESYLKGKGVKDEEIKWSGIRQYLEGKKSVNKAELMQYLKDNEFVIEEKSLTGSLPYVDDDQNEYHTISDIEAAGKRIAEERGLDSSKVKADLDDEDVLYAEIDGERLIEAYYPDPYELMDAGIDDSGNRWSDYKLDGGKNYREILFKIPNSNYINSAMSTHWGESGVLAHARIQDFDSADGGKVLFVEEIQSDWHNEGQKKGYIDTQGVERLKAERDRTEKLYMSKGLPALRKAADILKENGFSLTRRVASDLAKSDQTIEQMKEDGTLQNLPDEFFEAIEDIRKYSLPYSRAAEAYREAPQLGVPDAPFRTTYTDYVLKNLLRMAAERDYDYLAWTTGKMQEERWSDEFAEGYRIEYDQQIPKFLKKYGKQWGARLEEVNISDHAVPAIVVNDAMKKSVLTEGQPMFSEELTGEGQESGELFEGSRDAVRRYVEKTEAMKYAELNADDNTEDVYEVTDEGGNVVDVFKAPKSDEDVRIVEPEQKKQIETWEKTDEAVSETAKELKKRIGRAGKVNAGREARDMARKLREHYGSKAVAGQLASNIETLYQMLDGMKERNASEAAAAATNIGKAVIEGTMVKDNILAQQYPDLKKQLRSPRLYLSGTIRGDMAAAYDGMTGFRRAVGNRLRFAKEGEPGSIGVDSYYMELSEQHPELFPADIINPSEQLIRMLEVAKSLDGDKVSSLELNGYSADLDKTAYMIGQEILNGYYMAAGMGFTKELSRTMSSMRRRYLEEARQAKESLKRALSTDEKADYWRERYEMVKDNLAKVHASYAEKARQLRLKKQGTEARQELLKRARNLMKMAKKGTPDFRAQVDALIGDIDLVSPGIRQDTLRKLEELKIQVERQSALDPDYAKYEAPKYEELLKRVRKETKRLSQMDIGDINRLLEAVVALEHSKRTYDREIKKERGKLLLTYARNAIDQQKSVKGINYKNQFTAAAGKYLLKMQNPVRAMAMMDGYQRGGVFSYFAKELNDGQTKAAEFRMKAEKLFQDIDNNKKLVDDFAKPTIEIQTMEGKVKISKGMRIALYMHLQNMDNVKHIAYGGITIPDAKLYAKGKYEEAYNAGQTVHLAPWLNSGNNDARTAKAIRAITDQMTPEELEYAKIAKTFFDTMCKNAINETSLLLDGYEKANVDNYFPIKVDRKFLAPTLEGLQRDGTIEGMGALKERSGSRLGIMLEDVSQVVLRQKNNTALYYGLAIPVRNFTKFYGQTTDSQHGESVQGAIAKTWNKTGLTYIENLLEDLQFGRQTQRTALDAAKGLYAGTTLNLNLGVTIKQSASYPFAASVIGWKPLLQASTHAFAKKDRDYMDSITPWGYMRRTGFSGTEMGEVAKQRTGIDNNQTIQKAKSALDLIRRVDVGTTETLFIASEYYVKEKYPDLEVRGEEYNKKLAEVYNEVLQRTQPSYDVMQRNEFLRSQNDIAKIFGAFKTQTFNMGGEVIDAYCRWRAHSDYAKTDKSYEALAKQSRKAFRNTVAATLAAQAMLVMLDAAAKAIMHRMKDYRDERGEVTAESLAKKLMKDFSQSFAGLTMGGSEAQAIGLAVLGGDKWYDIEYPGLAVINELVSSLSTFGNSMRKLINADEDEAEKQKSRVSQDLAKVLMQAFKLKGVPTQNIYNIMNAVYLWGQELKDQRNGNELGLFDAGEGLFGLSNTSPTGAQYGKRAVDAYISGDFEKGDKAGRFASQNGAKKAMGDAKNQEDVVAYLKGLDITDETRRKLWELVYSPKNYDKNFK